MAKKARKPSRRAKRRVARDATVLSLLHEASLCLAWMRELASSYDQNQPVPLPGDSVVHKLVSGRRGSGDDEIVSGMCLNEPPPPYTVRFIKKVVTTAETAVRQAVEMLGETPGTPDLP